MSSANKTFFYLHQNIHDPDIHTNNNERIKPSLNIDKGSNTIYPDLSYVKVNP